MFSLLKKLIPQFWLFVVLVLLIIAMKVSANLFFVDTFIDHPQFSQTNLLTKIYAQLSVDQIFFFKAYFIIDFLMAATLLIYLGSLIRHWKTLPKKAFIGYCILAVFAYLFDVMENISYLKVASNLFSIPLTSLSSIKQVFYIASILLAFYAYYCKAIHQNMHILIRFVLSSSISLLVIGIVGLLLTAMDQGGTIVINLLSNGPNLLIFYCLLIFLSLIVSHYPFYIEAKLYNLPLDWEMLDKKPLLGFGTIIYHHDPNKKPPINFPYYALKFLRHSLGIVLHGAVIYVLIFVLANYYSISLSASVLSAVVIILILIFYRHILDHPRSKYKLLNSFPIVLGITFFLMILSVSLAQWQIWFVSYTILTIICLMICYTIFRVCRRNFNKFTGHKNPYLRLISKLGDEKYYLNIMRIAGTLLSILLVLINIFVDLAVWFNSLNIMLMYLIFFYSIIVLWIKHIMYYRDDKTLAKNKIPYGFYKNLLPFSFIVILILLFLGGGIKNDLHVQQTAKLNNNQINETAYISNLPDTDLCGNLIDYHFYVGSYGGGLRANLWNLLLLDTLQMESGKNFLHQTVVLSGVSGGSIGLGNFAVLSNNKHSNESDRTRQISKIGNYNFVSIDITSLLGRDFIREYVPFNWMNGKDRSYLAMKKYASLSNLEEDYFCNISFRDYWSILHKSLPFHYPAMVINSTSINGKQGIATSIEINGDLVPGSIDILKSDTQRQLTYYAAVSTSNRFPVFSPTAQIKAKGHFLDGGYFDNSGLLAAESMYEYMRDADTNTNCVKPPIYVSIINSKEVYIANRLDDWKMTDLEDENTSGEFGAILNTVASIEKIPNYITSKLKKKYLKDSVDRYIELSMPYPIEYHEVVNVLGGKPKNPIALMDSLSKHNEIIKETLENNGYQMEWGVVEPPLARYLGKQVVAYQKAMLKHPNVANEINELLRYCRKKD